jgi:hypothetical protein
LYRLLCDEFADALVEVEGFVGVGFLPSHDHLFVLVVVLDCVRAVDDAPEDGVPESAGPFTDIPLAFVAAESLLMLGPVVTRPDWFGNRVVLPGGNSSILAPGGIAPGPNSC